ncbi:MAG: hypothetical protein IIB03_03620 [Acidobacteria bacterium]|nr:hypothetical protein [Acidobacteriota bacterium]
MNNYFNYFTEVEEYFVRKRGKNLLISPLDWCLVELWRDSGIPLHIVLRGIERSFESAARRQKSSPNTLFYCHQAILEAYQEYQNAMVGASEDQESESVAEVSEETARREAVLGYLEDLEKRLQGQEEEGFQRAGQRITALRSEVSVSQPISYQEIDRDLAEIGSMLASTLKEDMGRERARELGSDVKKELKIYRKRLSKEMYQRLEGNYLDRQILGLYDLPEFNLLGIDQS